ncbi:MAG TPA: hypothetical protein VFU59_00050 [Candidatus Eisenbacteria bacterium]|nr:hypothetical protein [Candidatus Eisenbacteria bacterium]
MRRTDDSPRVNSRPTWIRRASLATVVLVALAAGAAIGRSTSPPPPPKNVAPAKAAGERKNAAGLKVADRRLVTVRGEVVDYYCFIEKGLRGPGHLECAVKCVAGDVCMGMFTQQGELYMISVNHLRAMDPLAFKGIPDPFNRCRGLLSQTVDLTGYAMERHGQKILEIMDVKPVGPSTKG